MKLTNRIAAFQNVRKIDSEGGRRPSERTSATMYIYMCKDWQDMQREERVKGIWTSSVKIEDSHNVSH